MCRAALKHGSPCPLLPSSLLSAAPCPRGMTEVPEGSLSITRGLGGDKCSYCLMAGLLCTNILHPTSFPQHPAAEGTSGKSTCET